MRPRPGRDPAQAGVTLVDVMIGLTILAFVTAALFNIFLSGIAQAQMSGVRGEAAAWAQNEIEYLRYVGYTSACLGAGTRTITPTSVPCTSVEPLLPADLAQATVQVENNIGQSGLKRITIQVSHVAGIVLYTVVTYETQFL
jgi:Tfp pilus assembly protein PilV